MAAEDRRDIHADRTAGLLRSVDFDRASKKIKFADDREALISVNPSRPKGLPEELEFTTEIYGLKKGRAIAPHCHRNMTTMHMLIGGRCMPGILIVWWMKRII